MKDEIINVKEKILEHFAKLNAEVGHVFHHPSFFTHQNRVVFNPKEIAAFPDACNELEKEGIVDLSDGNMRLTERGFNKIYPEVGDSMKKEILAHFARNHAEAGHIFNDRNFFVSNNAIKFNPKERDAFGPAVEELEKEGYVDTSDGNMRLTEKGFNKIY